MPRVRRLVTAVGAAALLAVSVAGYRPKIVFSNAPRESQLGSLEPGAHHTSFAG